MNALKVSYKQACNLISQQWNKVSVVVFKTETSYMHLE